MLEVYLHEGRIEIDNNSVETPFAGSFTLAGQPAAGCLSPFQGARLPPPPLGGNWLFIGAAEAGQGSAILYTIIESCRRRGLNPSITSTMSSPACLPMTNWHQIHHSLRFRRHPPLKRSA